MSSWAVIVPTNRPDRYREFERAWAPLFVEHDVQVYSIFDGPRAEAPATACAAWEDIPHFVPRRTDMIRSWGIYLAWQGEHDYTLSLDDDVLPRAIGLDVFDAYEGVFEQGVTVSAYLDVGALTDSRRTMRGMPRTQRAPREVVVQYGGWHGMLDYDAETQLAGVPSYASFGDAVVPVPLGAACTCCAMNMAWRTDHAPMMWQLPLLEGRYNRWGDIWSGLLQKVMCDDARRAMVINGMASVRHERASDPVRNLELEQPGFPANERIWGALHRESPRRAPHPDAPLAEVYRYYALLMADSFAPSDPRYAAHFEQCLDQWLGLFA